MQLQQQELVLLLWWGPEPHVGFVPSLTDGVFYRYNKGKSSYELHQINFELKTRLMVLHTEFVAKENHSKTLDISINVLREN